MIRPFRPTDREAVWAINEANVPEVGSLDSERLDLLIRLSPFFRVVEVDGVVVGFLLGLTHESVEYPSKNFAWFSERFDRFAYVDRIALSEATRGQGWGPALYHEFEAWARAEHLGRLCAEINTIPANPRSLRFHELFGFAVVARTHPYGPDTEVAMVVKDLSPDPGPTTKASADEGAVLG